jgi:hypothetical protein
MKLWLILALTATCVFAKSVSQLDEENNTVKAEGPVCRETLQQL